METAFVLVSCEAGTTDTVTKKLQMMDEIKEVTLVWGAYDLVTKITAPTIETLKTIKQKIRTTNNVRMTVTLLLTEGTTALKSTYDLN